MEAWSRFLAHGLKTRLEPSQFGKYAALLNQREPLSAGQIADILIRPSNGTVALDPQIPRYIHALLLLDQIDLSSILRALLRYSSLRPIDTSSQTESGKRDTVRWNKSFAHEEAIMYGSTKVISSGARPNTEPEALRLITSLVEWMKVLSVPGVADHLLQSQGFENDGQNPETIAVRIAFGTLLVASSENSKILAALSKRGMKASHKAFSQSLADFVPFLHNASPMLAERLDAFRTQTLVPLQPIDKKAQAASDELDEIIDSTIPLGPDSIPVVDLPALHSRAGLYVYLQSLLVGRPLFDDGAILNYLHNRYQGDIQATCTDLILSSFDVLANAIFRNESTQTTILLRSFLINKVPLILTVLSQSLFPPITAEFCITEALSHVDTNTFPTFSSMFEETASGNMFSDSVRQDFCFACCLHDLIPEASIERLLGEIPMQTLPAGGRYVKEALVQQCLSDPERIEGLVEELEHMDGNVGAASQALTEMIGQFCRSKETMSLKALCSHLARKPSSMDIMLLFEKPATILRPICKLLDGWRYDEDQGEYQPVYEEFGCILLSVFAFVYRYNLSIVDLGLHATDSFVARLLIKGCICRPLNDLSEQEKSQLDGWIRGLFNAEGGGLGDETMSACPPQDFYLLVPTLFYQIVLACSTGHLHDEGLRGGLEYLVDTFLLPSLVGALIWLSHHLWESHGDSNAVVQILQILIKPGSISNEASLMLASVLNIVSKPLEHSLSWLQRSEPNRQDIEPLSKALKSHLGFSRTAGSDHAELESWTSFHGGGMANSVRHTIQLLVQWSLTPGINIMPTSYTHRQILVAVRILGAKRLLHAIIEEVKMQTVADSGSVALDVAVAIICSPDPNSSSPTTILSLLDETSSQPQPLQRRLTLRDALKTEAENAPKIHKHDVLQAETIIRLYRRVEAHMAVSLPIDLPAQPAMMDHHLGLGVADGAMDVAGSGVKGAGGMSGAQEIDEAIAAATSQDMMDLGLSDGMMGVGDDELLRF
ncbi:MAG: mediator complex subunit [Claussenomyces sp. TS43310]|nr:MAG: mediator complex subunit [Claussenomyces sp. TS43310]